MRPRRSPTPSPSESWNVSTSHEYTTASVYHRGFMGSGMPVRPGWQTLARFAAMANRSYLYSADTVPTPDHRPEKIRGISEHNWSIPLLHQLLAGRETRGCPSV